MEEDTKIMFDGTKEGAESAQSFCLKRGGQADVFWNETSCILVLKTDTDEKIVRPYSWIYLTCNGKLDVHTDGDVDGTE